MKDKIYILKILISGLLIYWLFASGKFDASVILKLSNPIHLLYLLIIYLLLLISNNTRWFLILRSYNFSISWLSCMKLTFIGLFFNFFVPAGSLGGDLVKGYYLIKDNSNKTNLASSILLDRYFALFAMAGTSLFVLLLGSHNFGILIFTGGLFLLCLIFFLAFVSNSVYKILDTLLYQKLGLSKSKWLKKIHKSFLFIIGNAKLSSIIFLLSFGSIFLYILFFSLTGEFMGFSIPFWIYVYAVPLTLIVTVLPISPGGLGVGQVAALGFFGIMSVDSNIGPATVSVFQLIGILVSMLGLVMYIQLKD